MWLIKHPNLPEMFCLSHSFLTTKLHLDLLHFFLLNIISLWSCTIRYNKQPDSGIHINTMSITCWQNLARFSASSFSVRLSSIAPLIKFARVTISDPRRKNKAMFAEVSLHGFMILCIVRNGNVTQNIKISLQI